METISAVIKNKQIINREIVVPTLISYYSWFYRSGCYEDVYEFILDDDTILEVTQDEYEHFSIGDSYTYQQDTELNKYLMITFGAIVTVLLALAFVLLTH